MSDAAGMAKYCVRCTVAFMKSACVRIVRHGEVLDIEARMTAYSVPDPPQGIASWGGSVVCMARIPESLAGANVEVELEGGQRYPIEIHDVRGGLATFYGVSSPPSWLD